MAQAEYDKQLEITKLLMEGLNAIQVYKSGLWSVHASSFEVKNVVIAIAVLWSVP
jgi:hypothetical protein